MIRVSREPSLIGSLALCVRNIVASLKFPKSDDVIEICRCIFK